MPKAPMNCGLSKLPSDCVTRCCNCAGKMRPTSIFTPGRSRTITAIFFSPLIASSAPCPRIFNCAGNGGICTIFCTRFAST